MQRQTLNRLVLCIVACICLLAVLPDLSAYAGPEHKVSDFDVYYTAALMIRHGQGNLIYADADTGKDPQLRWAGGATAFAHTAETLGVHGIGLYVYPPTLGDMVTPLTYLSLPVARALWRTLNVLALLGVALILVNILDLPVLSWQAGCLALAMLLNRPAVDSIRFGQVTILLGCLLVSGLFFYRNSRPGLAMMFVALAAAIKLTPLVLFLPLLAWRDWKALRALAGWLLAIFALLLLINGSGLLLLYVRHVLPSMSAGIRILTNKNLGTELEYLWRQSHHGTSPPGWLPKLIELTILAVATILSSRLSLSPATKKVVVMALFLVLACCLSPVAWRHAYVLAMPAVLLLAAAMARRATSLALTLFWALFTLSVSGYGLNPIAQRTGNALLYDAALLAPLLGSLMVFAALSNATHHSGSTPA